MYVHQMQHNHYYLQYRYDSVCATCIHVHSLMFCQVFTATVCVLRAAGALTAPSCVTVRTEPPAHRTRGPVSAPQDSEEPPARGVSHIKQTQRVEYIYTMRIPYRGCR